MSVYFHLGVNSSSLQLHYLRLPKDIHKDFVILMDATVATGAAAMMAIRVLLVRQPSLLCSTNMVYQFSSPLEKFALPPYLLHGLHGQRIHSVLYRSTMVQVLLVMEFVRGFFEEG